MIGTLGLAFLAGVLSILSPCVFDTGVFRMISAMLLIAVGVVLLVPRLQEQFALDPRLHPASR